MRDERFDRRYYIRTCAWMAVDRMQFVYDHLNFGKSRVVATKTRAIIHHDRRLIECYKECGLM